MNLSGLAVSGSTNARAYCAKKPDTEKPEALEAVAFRDAMRDDVRLHRDW